MRLHRELACLVLAAGTGCDWFLWRHPELDLMEPGALDDIYSLVLEFEPGLAGNWWMELSGTADGDPPQEIRYGPGNFTVVWGCMTVEYLKPGTYSLVVCRGAVCSQPLTLQIAPPTPDSTRRILVRVRWQAGAPVLELE